MARPSILLSNDDGWNAPGITALKAELEAFAEVIVCAPLRNQSACSHALTLHEVLRLHQHAERVFTVDGTPADCVYVALNANGRVVSQKPDIVVSGLNSGPNLGVDVLYSGTVAAAREAAIRGIPAIAVSADFHADTSAAAARAGRLVAATLPAINAESPTSIPLLNVNIPNKARRGARVTRLGRRAYEDQVVFRTDPRQRDYLWIGSGAPKPNGSDEADTDIRAFADGFVSVTPLTLDLTGYDHQPLARRIIEKCRDA